MPKPTEDGNSSAPAASEPTNPNTGTIPCICTPPTLLDPDPQCPTSCLINWSSE